MRRNALAAILIGTFAVLAPKPASAFVSVTIGISYFHDTLAPYGRWVVTEPYGEVWVPTGIAAGWDPYWDGEWIWTDYGWTWVSYDPWADVTYHYGTWVWVEPYGWVWEPGTVWAPAWVTWAWTDGYIGWAPVPATFVITTSGYAGAPIAVAPTSYVFVPATQFVGVNASTVRVPETQNAAILSRAEKGTRFTISGGVVRATADPPRNFVERVSRKSVHRMGIGKLRARPTTLAGAHISGKRIGVVMPARERAAAIAKTKANARVPGTRIRGKAARPAPARGVERRAKHVPGASARPAAVYRRESRHDRASRPSDSVRPLSQPNAAPLRPAAPPHAPAPAAHGNPHGAPPGQAAQPHARPAAPAGGGKEKKRG